MCVYIYIKKTYHNHLLSFVGLSGAMIALQCYRHFYTETFLHLACRNERCFDFCFSDIAGVLLESTGIFLDSGLQESCDEFWASADDSAASDEIRYSHACIRYGVRFFLKCLMCLKRASFPPQIAFEVHLCKLDMLTLVKGRKVVVVYCLFFLIFV